MSTYAKPEHHLVTVKVSHEDGHPSFDGIEFACSAPEDAPCRTYPECDCERFDLDEDNPGHDFDGHPFVSGRDCWVAAWFDFASMWDDPPYVGPDKCDDTDCGVPLVARTGHVSIVGFDDGGPEWEWAS